MMTNHDAKLYLAEMLPERIVIEPLSSDPESENVPCWLDRPKIVREGLFLHPFVLETEWQQIALWVEERMTDEKKYEHAIRVWILSGNLNWTFEELKDIYFDLSFNAVVETMSATYITRATAMKEAGITLMTEKGK